MKKTRLSALSVLAAAGGIVSGSAAAIELGELQVESTIGQPLRASIAYALGPNETLSGDCVGLNTGRTPGGLPVLTRGNVSVSNGRITIAGTAVLDEPIMTLRLDIACPYTARLSRVYRLLLNPAATFANNATASAALASTPAPARTTARPGAPGSRVTLPEVEGNAYRVQPGDTLTTIAQAVPGRDVGVSVAAEQILAANPDAFIDGNPDLLKAGSVLVIPAFNTERSASQTVAATPAANPARGMDTTPPAQEPPAEDAPASYETYEPPVRERSDIAQETAGVPALAAATADTGVDGQTTSAVAERGFEPPVLDDIDDTDVLEPVPPVDTESLRPGDVILDDDSVYSAIRESNNVIDGEEMSRPSSRATTEISTNSDSERGFLSAPARRGTILFWLAVIGGGILAIAGLLWFWLRGRDDDEPAAAREPVIEDVSSDEETLEAIAAPDYNLNDDSPTEENLALDEEVMQLDEDVMQLDADLDDGSGLEEAREAHATEDFGFAETTDLDFELPEEAPPVDEKPETDIIPPPKVDQSSILKSEVMPEDEDYDMSVMLDATKMPQPEDVTEKDLKAVVVDTGDDTRNSDDYTVSRDTEYDILEQDYEDELSATQALNQEIDKAASQISKALETPEVEQTGETRLDMLSELDVTEAFSTLEEPANDDGDSTDVADPDATEIAGLDEDETGDVANHDDDTELADLDATEVASLDEPEFAEEADTEIADLDSTARTEVLPPDAMGEDKTVEMPADGEEATVEMPTDSEDATVEMPKKSKNA